MTEKNLGLDLRNYENKPGRSTLSLGAVAIENINMQAGMLTIFKMMLRLRVSREMVAKAMGEAQEMLLGDPSLPSRDLGLAGSRHTDKSILHLSPMAECAVESIKTQIAMLGILKEVTLSDISREKVIEVFDEGIKSIRGESLPASMEVTGHPVQNVSTELAA